MASKVSKIDTHNIHPDKSKKRKDSKTSIQGPLPPQSLEEIEEKDIEPHQLNTDCIIIRDENAEKLLNAEMQLIVPCSSPRSTFIYDQYVDTLPKKIILKLEELHLPYIRVLGIRKTIEMLGEFFGCTLYRTSHSQFWFLDMITDCLWKCQDEFILDDHYQKSVLGWILYFFDLIRDPMMNLSRGQFFRLFRETMTLAEDRIQCGDSCFPRPDELFVINDPPEFSKDFDAFLTESSDSSLSFDDSDSEHSFLIMPSEEYPDLPDFYKLPSRKCKCDIISITSSLETLSEKSILLEKDDLSEETEAHNNSEDDSNIKSSYSLSEFYQPDVRVHSRFLEEMDEDSVDISDIVEVDSSDLEYEWVNDIEKPSPKILEKRKSAATLNSHDTSVQSSIVKKIRSVSTRSKTKAAKISPPEDPNINTLQKKQNEISEEEKKIGQDDLLKAWFEYKLWEQRKEAMADPNKGWKPPEPEICADDCICAKMEYTPEDFENDEYLQIKQEWMLYLEKHKLAIDQSTQNVFVHSCLLLIIKQFVFEYFYESFQYKLVKMAYQAIPNLIYEKLNTKWLVPKENRGELKRPAEKKPKPPKPTKQKSPKAKDKKQKRKEDKKSKSSKGSSKKEKKPKNKPEKQHKPTKEEKEEMERLKREEQLRRMEEIAAEENKRFIFPLGLAADEDFFKSIFEDYSGASAKKEHDKKQKKKK